MAEGKTVASELGFEERAGSAGAEGSQAAGLIEVDQLVHAGEVDGEAGLWIGEGVDMADDAGAASKGDQAGASGLRIVNQGADVCLALRVCNPIRIDSYATRAQRDPIGQTLAAGMEQSGQGAWIYQGVRGQRCGRDIAQAIL
jgi:hypothetical protein